MFDVFVSYKSYNIDGTPTIENQMAQVLAQQFEQAGIRAFFSEGSYRRTLQPSYGTAVDSALTDASIMLVLAADTNTVIDRWVEYEWRYFSNAVNSGVKQGCLLTVIYGISPFHLPPALANAQAVDWSYAGQLPAIIADLLTQLNYVEPQQPQTIAHIQLGEEYIPADVTELDASERDIRDISELVWLRQLRALKLSGNRISDLTALTALHELVFLDLSCNGIADISPLSGLGQLRTLELWNNRIYDISPLAALDRLETLRLWRNHISDLAPLAGLSRLVSLELAGNHISNLAPLAGMRSLRSVELGGNEIADISPLERLTGLRTLWLNNNRVTDLAPLSRMVELETLHLEGNPELADLEPLYALPNLSTVWLSDCPGISAEAALDLRYEKPDCAVIFD